MASLLGPLPQPNATDRSSASRNNDLETNATFEVETISNRVGVAADSDKTEIKDDGVFLTWKNLWVTVPVGKKGNKPILQGLTGYAQPGELLAIMGPSGSGKSTFLDALAGRLSTNINQAGEILINGHKQALAYGTSAYVTQDDTLVATLTVREAVYYSAQLQLPDTMSNLEKKERAEMTIREMGLQDAMDTRIGGWRSKGISGGEKRRVSICIEILTRPKLLFLDEPTSGLDSAASYYVMQRIASLIQNDGTRITILVSIHQPSSEVFQLFNNLCLLSSGKMIYFGAASAANEFFAINGFPCSLQNSSDHFLKIINKDFEKDLQQGLANTTSTDEVLDILMRSYKSSETYQQVRGRIAEIFKEDFAVLEEKRSRAGFRTQCLVLTRRSLLNMHRDPGYYWLRLAIYIVLSLCLASVFYDLGISYSSIQARGSLLMFISTFLTFMTIGGYPSFVEEMKVFEKERLNGHYSATAFVVGNTLSAMPFLLLISLVPGATSYFIPGLHEGYEHFLSFAAIIFASMMLIESMMMAIASVVPNFLMGFTVAVGIQGLMALSGGFFRLPNDLPKPFWKYPVYYISFHTYTYQGLFKNEFAGLTFSNNPLAGGPAKIGGEQVLREIWQVEMGHSKWVDVAVLLGMAVFYRLLFLTIIHVSEKIKPLLTAFATVPPELTTQVAENPIATPMHERDV